MGSPVLSDSSTRNTRGRMTRKPTTSRTITVMIACQLRRFLRSSAVSDVKTGSTPRADDAVPFLGEVRTILLEGVPVGREQELHVLERHAAARRRDAGLGEDEGKRRALSLELDVARVLRAHDDLVLAVDQTAVLLDVGVEGARLVLGELLEVFQAEDRLQHVPH